jgi:hypothetical protein
MFRGHADSRYQVIPAAFRTTCIGLSAGGGAWKRGRMTQVDAERRTIRAFFEHADGAELSLPEDSHLLRAHIFDEPIAARVAHDACPVNARARPTFRPVNPSSRLESQSPESCLLRSERCRALASGRGAATGGCHRSRSVGLFVGRPWIGRELAGVSRRTRQKPLHFTLPIDQAAPQLRLLAKEGVSGTALFPGYGGVVAGLHEERFWRTKSTGSA